MRRFNLLLIAAAVSAAPAVATSAPLLQYGFDEASGQAIDTGTGAPANGDLQNGAVRAADTPSGAGSSVNFNVAEVAGSPARVLSTDAAKLDGLGAVTLTTWLKVNDYPSGNHRLVAKQNAGTFGGFNFSMNAAPNDGPVGPDNFRLGMFIGNNVSAGATDFGAAFSSADAGADEQWAFLAVSYDSSLASNNTVFYMGGVNTPVTQLGAAQTLPQVLIDGGVAPFGVGYTHAAPTADTSVKGLQDDVRVYGEALDLAALDEVRLSNVPEPASIGMMVIAGAGALARRRRHA